MRLGDLVCVVTQPGFDGAVGRRPQVLGFTHHPCEQGRLCALLCLLPVDQALHHGDTSH